MTISFLTITVFVIAISKYERGNAIIIRINNLTSNILVKPVQKIDIFIINRKGWEKGMT